jgi:hypothetical protein
MEPRSETQVGRHEKTMEVGFGGQEFLHTSERTIGPATPLPKSGSRRSPDSSSIGSASDLKFSISTSNLNLHQIPQLPQSKKAFFPHFQDSSCTRNTIREGCCGNTPVVVVVVVRRLSETGRNRTTEPPEVTSLFGTLLI